MPEADQGRPSLADLTERAREVRRLYDRKNEEDSRPAWNASAFMLGFVADVGALSKLVMAREGLRHVDDLDKRIAHELADCLWSIMILAEECEVDLAAAFLNTIDELQTSITREQRRTVQ